jgi:DNA-binding response OmpR family regulator
MVPVAHAESEGEALERRETKGNDREASVRLAAAGKRGAQSIGGDAGEGDAEDERATVLVVEDNGEMRAYLREELSEQWTVLEAADGAEGWERVQAETPDLVVSDVMMPNVGGFELCERIKSDETLRTIPVLLLTARARETDAVEGLAAGADDYVAKPFDAEELRQRITNHLAARRHLRAHFQEEVRLDGLDALGEVDADAVPMLEQVVEAVEGHLDNPDFTVGDLASSLALSRRQLTRRLKQSVGETPGDVIHQLRMERAKTLLVGAESVAEVAYAVGYRSPSSFSQSFRKATGMTPSAYAEAQQED